MSLENAGFIKDLIITNPEGTDPKSQGDDHLRMLKKVLKQQFPGFTQGLGINRTETEINAMVIAGAYGLGAAAVQLPELSMNNADLPTAFYYVFNEGAGIVPNGNSGYLINIDNASPDFSFQAFFSTTTTELFVRSKQAGAFSPWYTNWSAANRPAQTSPLDIGAAAMLAPGSFGLGVAVPTGGTANLNEAPYAKTTYNARWTGASWVNQPALEAAGVAAIVELESINGTHCRQRFISIANGSEYVRYLIAGSWTPWWTLAPVTEQLLANPGYQVINRICRQWGAVGPIADDASAAVTFPRAFTAVFTAQVTPIGYIAGTTFLCGTIQNLTATALTVANLNNAGASVTFYWEATGYV